MKRYFNITGSCNPQRHYMVNLDDRLKSIKEKYIDYGKYFVINKGRQYGKTTTLDALEKYLKDEYIVLSLDFQEMETGKFANDVIFSQTFAKKLATAFRYVEAEDKEKLQELLLNFKDTTPNGGLSELFECLSIMCDKSSRPIVLMIDEVDSASNNQVFVDFLAQLRGYYLKRDKMPIFHSVVLAGVYNIKNLKLKLRHESEHQYNSPWNIAADLDIDMSFSSDQIATMLQEYESDNNTGMDIPAIANEIYQYTSGYPILVSLICKKLDEDTIGRLDNANKAWSKAGINAVVKKILLDKG